MALFELAIDAGASESAGVAGSVIVVVLNQGSPHSTRAYIDGGAFVHSLMGVDVEAADNPDGTKKIEMYAGQVSIGESAGVGAAATILVRNSTVDAGVRAGAHVDADGGTGLTVKANQSGNITLLADGASPRETAALGGSGHPAPFPHLP